MSKSNSSIYIIVVEMPNIGRSFCTDGCQWETTQRKRQRLPVDYLILMLPSLYLYLYLYVYETKQKKCSHWSTSACHTAVSTPDRPRSHVNSLSKHTRARRVNSVGWGRSKHASMNRKYSAGLALTAVWTRDTREDPANISMFECQTVLKAELPWGIWQ